MDRRSLLGGLFGLPFTQQLEKPRRELQKLKREPALKGIGPVCGSMEVLDVAEVTTDKVDPRYGTLSSTITISGGDSRVTVTPAPKRLAACGQCGTCYLTKNPKVKEE